ncbi:hypothetical protein LPJ71_001481 [Coemansia sp. S17]|nr:hypothetical protein LPJ71_001481 [Coemansia sp. S17]KAJ2015586.1 hypothetical protein GGI14_004186 [Coemansia sp. S680]
MTPLPIQPRITSTPPPLPVAISASASCGSTDGPNGIDDNLQCTPQHKPRQQMMPQSAPPPNSRRTQLLLASPAAVKRSNESLEAIRVAQTLKAGFSRLKARADSQNSSSSAPLPQRAFSATSPAPVTPARRQLLYRHHSSISFSRGSPATFDNTLRPSGEVPMSRGPSEPVVSPSLRPLHPPYSCPQRRQSFREHRPSLLFPAPRFSLERAQSAASSTSTVMHSPPPSTGSSKRANKEIAEAAETMILFMRDSPTQSEERRTLLRPSDGPSSPTFGPPHIMLPEPQRASLEYCPADLAPQTTGEDIPVLRNAGDVESEDEYAPLPSTSTASMSRLSIKRSRTDHSSSGSSSTGPSLPSKRVNIGH